MRRFLIPTLLLGIVVLALTTPRRAVVADTAVRAQTPDSLARVLLAEAAALEPTPEASQRAGFQQLLAEGDLPAALAQLRATEGTPDEHIQLTTLFARQGDLESARAVVDLAAPGAPRDAVRAAFARSIADLTIDPLPVADSIASAEYRLAAYLGVALARPDHAQEAWRRANDLVERASLPRSTSQIATTLAGLYRGEPANVQALVAHIRPATVRATILGEAVRELPPTDRAVIARLLIGAADSVADPHDRLYWRMHGFFALGAEDSARVATTAFVEWANGAVVSNAGRELVELGYSAGTSYPVSPLVLLDAVARLAPPQVAWDVAEAVMSRWSHPRAEGGPLRVLKDSAVAIAWRAADAYPPAMRDSMRAEILGSQATSFPQDALDRLEQLASEPARDLVRLRAASVLLDDDSTAARVTGDAIATPELRDLWHLRRTILPATTRPGDVAAIVDDTIRALATVLTATVEVAAEHARVRQALPLVRMGWFQRLPQWPMYGFSGLQQRMLKVARPVVGDDALAGWARAHPRVERAQALRAVAAVLDTGPRFQPSVHFGPGDAAALWSAEDRALLLAGIGDAFGASSTAQQDSMRALRALAFAVLDPGELRASLARGETDPAEDVQGIGYILDEATLRSFRDVIPRDALLGAIVRRRALYGERGGAMIADSIANAGERALAWATIVAHGLTTGEGSVDELLNALDDAPEMADSIASILALFGYVEPTSADRVAARMSVERRARFLALNASDVRVLVPGPTQWDPDDYAAITARLRPLADSVSSPLASALRLLCSALDGNAPEATGLAELLSREMVSAADDESDFAAQVVSKSVRVLHAYGAHDGAFDIATAAIAWLPPNWRSIVLTGSDDLSRPPTDAALLAATEELAVPLRDTIRAEVLGALRLDSPVPDAVLRMIDDPALRDRIRLRSLDTRADADGGAATLESTAGRDALKEQRIRFAVVDVDSALNVARSISDPLVRATALAIVAGRLRSDPSLARALADEALDLALAVPGLESNVDRQWRIIGILTETATGAGPGPVIDRLRRVEAGVRTRILITVASRQMVVAWPGAR